MLNKKNTQFAVRFVLRRGVARTGSHVWRFFTQQKAPNRVGGTLSPRASGEKVKADLILVAFRRCVQFSYEDDERSHHRNQEPRGDAHDSHFYLMKGRRRKCFHLGAMQKIAATS